MHPNPDPAQTPGWRPLRPHDPTRLGQYELLGRLGSGGMGVVYAARALQGGDLVALKVIRAELTHRPELRERFRREVAAARRVAPFCTASVLDADVDGLAGGVQYIVSEYVAGPTLDRVVRQQGPPPSSGLHALAVGVAGALSAIHAAGIVHRDLKPSNVLLGATGPRVIDFGMARMADGAMLTTHSGSTGTPAYMAPELHQGHEATPAADVFAWGAAIAFAGTGRPVFGGGAGAAVAYRIVWGEPDLDGFDPHLRPLVELALAKDPARRPSARELLLRLTSGATGPKEAVEQVLATRWRPVAEAASRSAAVPTPEPTLPRSAYDARRRRSALAVVGGIMAAVITLGIAGFGVVALVSSSRNLGDRGSTSTSAAAAGGRPGAPPELPGVGLLLADDFTTKANGWNETTLNEGSYASRYVDGGYEMTSGQGGGLFYEATFIDTNGVHYEVDATFRANSNPKGALKVTCPIVVSDKDPGKLTDEELDALPKNVAVLLHGDGSWKIVANPDEYDYSFDDKTFRILAEGKWAGFRTGQANRLTVTCIPAKSGRKAKVITSLNDADKRTYDGVGLEGIGDSVQDAIDLSSPVADGVDPDTAPRTTVLIDNVEVWGTEG
jgi:hypothetical protein